MWGGGLNLIYGVAIYNVAIPYSPSASLFSTVYNCFGWNFQKISGTSGKQRQGRKEKGLNQMLVINDRVLIQRVSLQCTCRKEECDSQPPCY